MITVVVDSTAYFTKKEAAEFGIVTVPLAYSVNGIGYRESYADANGDYEALIGGCDGNCNTYQRNTNTYAKIFEKLVNEGREVFCVTISSRLSGAFSSARIASKKVGRGKVRVFDTLLGAGGLYLMAKKAAALAAVGLDADRIEKSIKGDIERIGICFSVDDISCLKRGGRLGNVPQISPILNYKPFFKLIDGSIVFDKMSRGDAERFRHLTKCVPRDAKRVIVQHISHLKDAQRLCEQIEKDVPDAMVELRRLGPVLAVHLGLGCLVVTYEE